MQLYFLSILALVIVVVDIVGMSTVDFAKLPRIYTVNDRIRGSERFPRIRDAERDMATNEAEFRHRLESKKKKKAKEAALKLESNKKKRDAVNLDYYKKVVEPTPEELFTKFTLTKDPKSSQYMTYSEVFFPKLFDPSTAAAPPESIDRLWMLGFQDEAIRKQKRKK